MNYIPQNYSLTSCELFVGNLHENVTEDMLFYRFHQFGKLLQVKIYRHVITKKSLGYGFITFARPHEAQRAKANCNRSEMVGRRLRVCLVDEYYSLNKGANLLVRGLPDGLREEELEATCEKFGPVFSVKLIEEDSPDHKAYVQFETLDAAEQCKKQLKEIGGKTLIVEPAVRKVLAVAKGPFLPNAQQALREEIAKVAPCTVTGFEVDEEKTTFFATIKFESEAGLRGFLADWAKTPSKCELTRPDDKGLWRHLKPKRNSQEL